MQFYNGRRYKVTDPERKEINKAGNEKITNGYDMILQTYNSKKYPVIPNQTNALVFPWSMQRDVDAIDTMRFVTETTDNTVERGIEGIPASPTNRTISKK